MFSACTRAFQENCVRERKCHNLYVDRVEVQRRVATARRQRLEVVLRRGCQQEQVQQHVLDQQRGALDELRLGVAARTTLQMAFE